MKRTALFLLIYLIGFQTVFAQSFFEKVSGHLWKGTGELLGSEATFKMEWKQVLDNKFYQLSFQNQRENSKEYIFKAIGFYKIKDNTTINGTWFDSRGYSFPLKGNLQDNKLVVYWGSPEYEEGKTIYSIQPDGRIEVQDYFLRGREFVNFGKAEYISKK